MGARQPVVGHVEWNEPGESKRIVGRCSHYSTTTNPTLNPSPPGRGWVREHVSARTHAPTTSIPNQKTQTRTSTALPIRAALNAASCGPCTKYVRSRRPLRSPAPQCVWTRQARPDDTQARQIKAIIAAQKLRETRAVVEHALHAVRRAVAAGFSTARMIKTHTGNPMLSQTPAKLNTLIRPTDPIAAQSMKMRNHRPGTGRR